MLALCILSGGTHLISWSMFDLSARAGGPIALLCTSCVIVRLLLICDVESALSLLGAVVIRTGGACGVRARVLSCRAEFSRWLGGEVVGLVEHVGPCQRRW